MVTTDTDLWHQVHAQREDGVPAMFQIRELAPRPDLPQIFMIELPYEITDGSKLPDEAGYLRLDEFQEHWVEPACEALGWTFVAWKSEDGAFSLYLYGNGDPNALLERLAPFDESLGFYNEADPAWSEYAALRELVEQAEVAEGEDEHVHGEECDHDHGDDEYDGAAGEGEQVPTRKAKAPAQGRGPARAAAKKPAAKKATADKPAAKQAKKPAAKKPAAKKPVAKKPASKRR